MDIINILPDSVANQIAAGEVVDRPAGAVKELLENALDAGATQIDLVVKDAGRTLIQVIDNGCGMSDSDARLCCERHATSKIHRADDLFAIHTMGFRGEALASIAAISQTEIRTRQPENELGTELRIEGSHIVSQKTVVCQKGTSISVKNLFFNVPARRNFLKKDSVELSHIEEVFRRITLIHYDTAFSFSHNGKLLYTLAAGSLLARIAGLFGPSYREKMYAVDEETDIVTLHGFVSRPEYSRRTRGEQYLFVNGRFIKHPALSTAVERAYADLLPDRSYPSYFIGLQVDPSRIDINIHPTKTEVKFADESALFSILRSAVKKALGQFSLATELSFDTPEEFNIGPAPKDYVPVQPVLRPSSGYNPFRATGGQTRMAMPGERAPLRLPEHEDDLAPFPVGKPAEWTESFSPTPCMQIQGRYIATSLPSGLALVDQQRAHERVIYDRLTAQDGDQGETAKKYPSQTLLFPHTCRFSAADAELLGELAGDLRHYGFELSAVGKSTFVVSATPPEVKEHEMQQLLDQLLTDYKGSTMQKYSKRSESLCLSLARQMAVKSGTVLSQEEMQQLVADLFACPMAEVSPSGKRIITIVKPEELLK